LLGGDAKGGRKGATEQSEAERSRQSETAGRAKQQAERNSRQSETAGRAKQQAA
jgi:hypothetical protein